MYIVLDQQNNPIALLENMMILDYNDKSVIGILIGDCFFGKQNHVIGKIFNEYAYLVSGDIIGKVVRNENYSSTAPTLGSTWSLSWASDTFTLIFPSS